MLGDGLEIGNCVTDKSDKIAEPDKELSDTGLVSSVLLDSIDTILKRTNDEEYQIW